MQQSIRTWTTTEEIEFIEGIGLHGVRIRSVDERIDMLEGYIHSLKNRQEWGKIDKDICLARAKRKLDDLIR